MNKVTVITFGAINVACMIIYLILERSLIRPRADYEVLNGIDQLHSFVFRLLPVLLIIGVFDCIWLFIMRKKKQDCRLVVLLGLLIAASWCFTIQYNGLALDMVDVIWILI